MRRTFATTLSKSLSVQGMAEPSQSRSMLSCTWSSWQRPRRELTRPLRQPPEWPYRFRIRTKLTVTSFDFGYFWCPKTWVHISAKSAKRSHLDIEWHLQFNLTLCAKCLISFQHFLFFLSSDDIFR